MRPSPESAMKVRRSRSWWLCAAIAVLGAAAALAVPPLPADKRIGARVVQTIAAPADDALHMPTDVAVDSQGRIYVADGAGDRIVRFSAAGKFDQSLRQFGQHRLRRPIGLTVDASDRLWIADTGNHRVLLVSADHKEVQALEPPALEGGHGVDPTDVAVTADLARTYVVDNENHRILVRDNRNGNWTALGKYGRALGQFQWPFMLCLGPRGYLSVTEVLGARIQQISPADRWAGEIGTWGVELGQLYRPKGIVADAAGRLLVGDSTTGVIQVFLERGQLEGALSGEDGRPLRFEHPMGLCLDAQGRLLVVELGANRVAVVSLEKRK